MTIASRRVGERQAIVDARSTTVARAEQVSNAITDGILRSDPDAIAAVARVVKQGGARRLVGAGQDLDACGTIVYSDEPRLIGTTYDLGADELDSLARGAIQADVSDLTKPENRYERPFQHLLEVYLPVYTPSGEPVLFEAYYRYDAVVRVGFAAVAGVRADRARVARAAAARAVAPGVVAGTTASAAHQRA